MNENTLIIRHVGSDPDRFEVMRLTDRKRTEAVEIESPDRYPVEGRPSKNLSVDLCWYLEKFLDYPFDPDTEIAKRVQDSLRQWGENAFNVLFDNREGAAMLNAATNGHYKNLYLQIAGKDSRILGWPWEALRDPKANYLAHTCQIERRLDSALDPPPLSERLPKDRINILLVTARPFKNDVKYRSISRLLVELVDKKNLPAHVHILRPPTFDALREQLRKKPNHYHILHFDGHGAYGNASPDVEPSGHTLKGSKQGCLVFETEDGSEDPIQAEQLSSLLREYTIPAVVLNACQSAMIDEGARNEFASVASSLIQSGVRSVVAMAWSLYVTGAQHFLPALYQRLFDTGCMARAVRAGRQQMFLHKERVCPREKYPLEDWIVPVIYQQAPADFSFASQAVELSAEAEAQLPPEIKDTQNPYGFIGRDGAIMELERAVRSKAPAILIHGLGGAGKTTLAKGFVQWLADTQGLGAGCFWFAFDDIRSAQYVINRMGEALYGGNFSLADINERINALSSAFKQHRFIIVWDNFEVVCGMAGTKIAPTLSDADTALLKRFLKALRGSSTKVLITSRSEEAWLAHGRRKVGIGGLESEERWLFLEEIVDAAGIKIDRDDPDLVKLMDLLAGHPLSMRVMLPLLEKQTAAQLIEVATSDIERFKKIGGDDAAARFYATLEVATTQLTKDYRPLLLPLALFEKYVHLKVLEQMARQVSALWTQDKLTQFAQAMVHMGLLYELQDPVYELHPALTGYLRADGRRDTSEDNAQKAWNKAFVDVMGGIADDLTSKSVHEKRPQFHLFEASFYHAMDLAEQIALDKPHIAILQSLAAYAQQAMNFGQAVDLFKQMAEACHANGQHDAEAGAYHQLGMIAEEQRDFQTTEKWYRKSLEIKERQGNEHGAALTYHQLGRIAEQQQDFQTAEKWYRKSLEITERQGNEHGAASTYGQMGILARLQEEYEVSGRRLIRSMQGFLNTGDRAGVQQGVGNFVTTYKSAPAEIREKLKSMWDAASFGDFPEITEDDDD